MIFEGLRQEIPRVFQHATWLRLRMEELEAVNAHPVKGIRVEVKKIRL
jgi:hypothetical protein